MQWELQAYTISPNYTLNGSKWDESDQMGHQIELRTFLKALRVLIVFRNARLPEALGDMGKLSAGLRNKTWP